MIFYYFGGIMGDYDNLKTPANLEKHHFSGVMFTHDIPEGDMFVKAARDINPNENIKYLVAIRPYTISPQYIHMINQSMSRISKNRLQINFIFGYIKDHEANFGGIVGEINDSSSSVDRSNYMIKFLEILNQSNNNKLPLDFYVSTTNEYVFDIAKKYNNKIILPYSKYVQGTWSGRTITNDLPEKDIIDLTGIETMIALTPIIRKTHEEISLLTNYAIRPAWKKGEIPKVVDDVAYFTYQEFDDFIITMEKNGINHLLINAVPVEEEEIIIPFIKDYVESRENKEKEI